MSGGVGRYVPPVGKLTRMFRSLATLVMLAVLTGCADASETSASDNPIPSPPTTAPVVTTTTTPPSTTGQTSPCLSGDHPFSSSGIISAFGGAGGDAAQISGLKAEQYPGCERIVLELLTADGAPAGSLGLVGVEYDAELGIVRINLPRSIARTSVADLRFDGELAERAYVVQTAEGNLGLDLHVVAGSSVALRAFEATAPTRIVIDLKVDPEIPAVVGAVSDDHVVVTSPGQSPRPCRR